MFDSDSFDYLAFVDSDTTEQGEDLINVLDLD